MFDYNLLGQKIKQIRENNGLTQEELSELINCTPKFLSRVETGKKNISTFKLIQILNCLHISYNDLFENNLININVSYKNQILRKINSINLQDYDKELLIDILISINKMDNI